MYIRQVIDTYLQNADGMHDKEGKRVSVAQIQNLFRALRDALLNRVGSGDPVGIFLDRDWRYIIAVLACSHAGIPWVPLSRKWPDDWLQQQVDEADICLLIAEDDEGPRGNLPLGLINDLVREGEASPVEALPELEPGQTAYVRFTSGSTGKPKGAVIARRGMENHFRWIDRYYPVTSDDRMLFVSQFTFDLTILDIALLVLNQPDFYFSGFEYNVFKLMCELEFLEITTIVGAPNLFNLIVNDDLVSRLETRFLRNMIIAGSRFPYGLYTRLRKHFPDSKVDNSYGPTEATNLVSSKRLTWDESADIADYNVSIGQAVDNMTLSLFDSEWNIISTPDTPGELCIAGVQLMEKYVNDPDRTAESLCQINGVTYYRSGDLAYFDDKGDFFIVGRVGDTVKVKGHRINLLDIDAQLQTMVGVQDCATVAVESGELDYFLVCFVVPGEGLDEKSVRSFLKEKLPSEQIPEHVEMVKVLPVNDSGKVDRKSLAKRYQEEHEIPAA